MFLESFGMFLEILIGFFLEILFMCDGKVNRYMCEIKKCMSMDEIKRKCKIIL